MSRLNTVMRLVTNKNYDRQFMSMYVPDPFIVVAVNSRNELIYVTAHHSDNHPIRYIIPKGKVVQIVTGFSEIA